MGTIIVFSAIIAAAFLLSKLKRKLLELSRNEKISRRERKK